MYKNRQHPTEVECRLFCCPILLGRCRFCSFLKLLSYRHTAEALQFFSLEQPLVGWALPAAPGDGAWWRALCVFYNPTDTARVVPLPAGRWKLLSDGTSSSLWRGESRTYEREALLMPYSATVFGAV